MFLITPKPKAPARAPTAVEATRNQPLAKITKPTRVQNACDRCRLKKVKCDGERPCLRCSQDQTPCMVSKKPVPSDPKLVLREYVQSMESQQTRLIKALQKVHRDVRQSIKEEDMDEIVQIVRACGFDFETVPASRTENGVPEIPQEEIAHESNGFAKHITKDNGKTESNDKHRLPTSISQGNGCRKKRKRGTMDDQINSSTAENSDHVDKDITGKTASSLNGPFDDGFGTLPSPLKRRKSLTSPSITDDYWVLDDYWDQIIRLSTPSDSTTPFPAPIAGQPDDASLQYPSHSTTQWPSNALTWGLENASQPAFCTDSSPRQFVDRSQEVAFTAGAVEPSSSDFLAGLDWESTLWWDPSLVFDTEKENHGFGIDGQDSQTLGTLCDFEDPGS